MTCPDEPTLMMLADDELEGPAAAAVRAHAGRCASCRKRLTELRAERSVLVEVLHEGAFHEGVAAPDPVVSNGGRSAAGGGWWNPVLVVGVLVVGLGATVWARALATVWQVPPFLEWVSPFHASGLLTWLFAGITVVVQAGTLLASMVTAVGQTAALFLLLLLAVLVVPHRARRATMPALSAMVFAAVAVPAEALVVRTSDDDVVISADETVDDVLLARGWRVLVDGVVTGDLIVYATTVTIRGTVQGSVISWSQSLDLEGGVEGSVFTGAQFVTVRGRVDGSLFTFSQETRIAERSRVGRSVASYSNVLSVHGEIAHGVRAAGGSIDIAGPVRRNVDAAAQRITVGSGGHIGGKLIAEVRHRGDLRIDPAATLASEPVVRLAGDGASPSRYLTASFYFWQSLWLVAALIAGGLLLWLAPAAATVRFETPSVVVRTLGVGFLCVVATPVAALLVAMTLVGLPLAILLLGLWALAVYLAKITVAILLGRAFLGPRSSGRGAAALLVGLLAVFVAVNLPIVGWIANLGLTLFGVGALFVWALAAYRGAAVAPARV
jgi:hypothetical protein